MRVEAREAVKLALEDIDEALDADDPSEVLEAVAGVRERLSLLLERDAVEAETVERYDAGARLRVKMTRGSDVRDQDEWTIEGSGRTAEDARAEFETLLDAYTEELGSDVRGVGREPAPRAATEPGA